MRREGLPVSCYICGGPGVASFHAVGQMWRGSELSHSDPRVCKDYLAERAAELNRKEQELSK